jgi:ethanolamine ammonia-lyase large subunit
MPYHHTVRGERFAFPTLADLLAKANEKKSGDELAGIAARSERERVAAKLALADTPLFRPRPTTSRG